MIEEGHHLNEQFRYVMDGEFYARLHAEGKKFIYFPRILADFRWHGENLSLRNHGKSSIDDWLTLQKQYAETRAIRRTYGRTFFRDDNLNGLSDFVLYIYWGR